MHCQNHFRFIICRILWNPKVHHRLHKILPLVPILSQMNPFDNSLVHSSKIYINIIKPSTLTLSGVLFQSTSPKHRTHFSFSMYATCHAHLVLLDSVTLIFRVEEKLWSTFLCNFLQPAPICNTDSFRAGAYAPARKLSTNLCSYTGAFVFSNFSLILTSVTLASTSNTLPDDGVTAAKHVGAVLM